MVCKLKIKVCKKGAYSLKLAMCPQSLCNYAGFCDSFRSTLTKDYFTFNHSCSSRTPQRALEMEM